MIFISGVFSLMICVHTTPSILGILTSISMTSGLFSLTLRITSVPFDTVSVTSKSSTPLNIILRLWRISSWSSAIKILIIGCFNLRSPSYGNHCFKQKTVRTITV